VYLPHSFLKHQPVCYTNNTTPSAADRQQMFRSHLVQVQQQLHHVWRHAQLQRTDVQCHVLHSSTGLEHHAHITRLQDADGHLLRHSRPIAGCAGGVLAVSRADTARCIFQQPRLRLDRQALELCGDLGVAVLQSHKQQHQQQQ
jgi:hypothetical protein